LIGTTKKSSHEEMSLLDSLDMPKALMSTDFAADYFVSEATSEINILFSVA